MSSLTGVHIDSLRLRIAGMSERQGAQLGELVAHKLAQRWPPTLGSLSVYDLDIRIEAGGKDPEAIANRVVSAIIARATRRAAEGV